jgi:lipopolysaccharide export system protein LptA
MKYILIILLSLNILNAKTVDIDIQAEFFESNEAKNIVYFKGNVSMVKADDTLVCDEITLKTKINPITKNKDVVSYVAVGNVSFTLKDEESDLVGNGDKVTYDLDKQLYVVIGNGYLEDKANNKMIRGENIYINQKTGYTKIDGSKDKPVHFKFSIEEKTNDKK